MNKNTEVPFFSIIIPVYNAEKYLNQCIESIINQKYPTWELIMVDDGSTDNSGEICDTYAKNDSRIKVLHQKNSGPGAARNLGLDKARGDYVVFVDADDWVDPTFLDDYVGTDNKYDIVFQGHWKEKPNGDKERICELELKTTKVPEAIIILWNRDHFGYTWMKCFCREIIESHHIRFNTNVFFREDTIFTAQYFRYVSSVRVLPVANYHYRYLDSSLQHTRFNVREMLYVDDRIYQAFSCYFNDESFRIFTEHWYLVNLHNGIKKSFTRENSRSFTDNERKTLIEKCIEHRHKIPFSDYRYSRNPILNQVLKLLWTTNSVSLILNCLRWFTSVH